MPLSGRLLYALGPPPLPEWICLSHVHFPHVRATLAKACYTHSTGMCATLANQQQANSPNGMQLRDPLTACLYCRTTAGDLLRSTDRHSKRSPRNQAEAVSQPFSSPLFTFLTHDNASSTYKPRA